MLKRRCQDEYPIMDCSDFVGRYVWHSRDNEDIPNSKSPRNVALGQESFGRICSLYWDLGVAWCTWADSASGDWHPPLADSSGGHWACIDPVAGNFHRTFTKEGIQHYSDERRLARARCFRGHWA